MEVQGGTKRGSSGQDTGGKNRRAEAAGRVRRKYRRNILETPGPVAESEPLDAHTSPMARSHVKTA